MLRFHVEEENLRAAQGTETLIVVDRQRGPSYLYLQGRAIRDRSLSRALYGVSPPTACLQVLQVLLEEALQ